MEPQAIEKLRNYINNNKQFLQRNGIKIIPEYNSRVLHNIKEFGKFLLPESIKDVRDLALFIDEDNGICKRINCNNCKKNNNDRHWKLNSFCSYKCAHMDFSSKQKENNTCKKMTIKTKKSMGEKISEKIRNRIFNGTFTPNITNSWCHSKVKVTILGEQKTVRSSWEALFWIKNPNLLYELIKIPYFDVKKQFYRNYIVDFVDMDKKIIYEIKPKNLKENNRIKLDAAIEWCNNNEFKFEIISNDWIKENYSIEYLIGQPEMDRISMLLEKSIKYGN